MLEIISSENFSFQSYQNKNLEYIKDFIPWTKAQIQLMSDILLEQAQKPREKGALYWKVFKVKIL